QKAIKRRPVQVAAGEAAVVVMLGQADPARLLLALDESLGRFALGVEGIEFLLETILDRFPSVDSAANNALRRRFRRLGHGESPLSRSRKKRKPLVWEPVMALATAEREWYITPSNSKPLGRMRTC